ncbi:MAG: DUF881 domain-containing protein [Chthonomonadales bacterium]
MNVFTTGHRNQPWIWQVTALSFLLGLLLAGSLQTVGYIRRSGIGLGRFGGVAPSFTVPMSAAMRQQQKEIADLREHNTKLENALGKGNDQLKTLNDELQKVKIIAGLTEVHGPGIVITLQDSAKRPPSARTFEQANGIIHDTDLQQVLNELGPSGAEAVAVNNQRIVGRSSLRCVGPTVMVNNVPVAPPYVIRAIGDPNTLFAGMNLPYGVLDGIRRYDPQMVRIEKKQDIVLPPYTGSTEIRFAKPTVDNGHKSGRETHD